MPPDGYDSVTLPNAIIERLSELPGESHAETVRILLGEYKYHGSDSDSDVDLSAVTASLETIEERTGRIERTLEDLQR